jgi:hypothetical protein
VLSLGLGLFLGLVLGLLLELGLLLKSPMARFKIRVWVTLIAMGRPRSEVRVMVGLLIAFWLGLRLVFLLGLCLCLGFVLRSGLLSMSG